VVGAAGSVDPSRLRHPMERPIFIVSVLLNIALLLAAVFLLATGAEWLTRHPRVAKYVDEIRAAGIAAVLAPFVLTFTRNRGHAAVHANSVRLSRTQIPEIHDDFERMCATLGMARVPELYVSETAIKSPAESHSAWHVDYVVLDDRYLQADLAAVRDVYRFFLARELGRIHLGHTTWLDDILLAYVVRVPFLRNPLMHVRTYSHDRYAAYLAPDSIRGLVIQAAGRRVLNRVDVDAFVRQALELHGWWARAASMMTGLPRVAYRIQQLEHAGLLRHDAAGAAPSMMFDPTRLTARGTFM
jgi:hypothetical protein